MLENHWQEASDAFTRAIEADSTLWLAYARRAYVDVWENERGWEIGKWVDGQLGRIRSRLPEQDRLLVESWIRLTDSVGAAISSAEELISPHRFPEYWIGWMHYGRLLFHLGPHFGRGRSEAQWTLERTVELAPNLLPAWERLAWVYLQDRDTAGAARALAEMDRIGYSKEGCSGNECAAFLQLRFLTELVRGNGTAPAPLRDSVVRMVAERGGWFEATRPYLYGFQQAMLDVNRRAGIRFMDIEALAAGGAWDSAMKVLDVAAREDPASAQLSYQYAVAGAMLGALDTAEALRLGTAVRSARPPDDFLWRPTNAWLDGIMAWMVRDHRAMARAREVFRNEPTDWRTSPSAIMGRSLDGFALALSGNLGRAVRVMGELERGLANVASPHLHLVLQVMTYDRLALSRWLVALGDTTEAMRVLTWHEAHAGSPMGEVINPLVYLERARLEDAGGRRAAARTLYRQFLWRYDMPDPRTRRLVEEARAALARLGQAG
jgi:tetratricopeptide (TPR) repeat protein